MPGGTTNDENGVWAVLRSPQAVYFKQALTAREHREHKEAERLEVGLVCFLLWSLRSFAVEGKPVRSWSQSLAFRLASTFKAGAEYRGRQAHPFGIILRISAGS